MKYGVLTFGYSGFRGFETKLARHGFFDTNLGDNVQSLAVRRLYHSLDIAAHDIISVDRDRLAEYQGEPVLLPMNGCFFDPCFPLPANVIPIFIGFEAKEPVITAHLAFLRQFAPIGCRDRATAAIFRKNGVRAYVSGCLSLTFPPRRRVPTEPKVFVAYGTGPGQFPAEVLRYMPDHLLKTVEFVSQRTPWFSYPLSPQDVECCETLASALLADYRHRATLVVTPLHHAATPCIAMGIPVIVCRTEPSSRFSFIDRLLPVHVGPDYSGIDWAPAPVDIGQIRDSMILRFKRALARARNSDLVNTTTST